MNTKEIILNEAEKIFGEKGYYKTRMEDIARSAKIAKGTVYLYFKSKQDLFTSIIEKTLLEFHHRIKNASENKKDEMAKLKNIISEMIEEFANKEMFMRKVEIHRLMEDKDLRAEFKKRIFPIFKGISDYATSIIKEGIKKGKIKGKNPEIISAFIFGGIRNACLMHDFMKNKESLNKKIIEKEVFNIIEKGLFKRKKEAL